MHAIQGAMAVRRERMKRDDRDRRRMSGLRNGAEEKRWGEGPTMGAGAPDDVALKVPSSKADGKEEDGAAGATDSSSPSVTAFHLGVVFILIAFLLLFSGLISRSRGGEVAALDSDWSTLIGVGIALLLVGLFMVMVNRILTEREEEELAQYVHHRLARTRSGHALALREAESGEEEALAAHLQQHRRRRRHLSAGDFWNGPEIGRRGSTRSVSAGAPPLVVLNGKVLPAAFVTREASPAASGGGMRRHGGSRASLRDPGGGGGGGRRFSRAAEESEKLLPRRLSNPNVLPSSPRRSSSRRKNSGAPIIVCSPPSPSSSTCLSGNKR